MVRCSLLCLCLAIPACKAKHSGQQARVTSARPAPKPPPRASVASKAAPEPSVTATASASASSAPAPRIAEETPPVRRHTDVRKSRDTSGQHRMQEAKAGKTTVVKGIFAEAGLSWPPRQLLLRAFKKENRLEVWASDEAKGPLTHVTTYEICYASGELGPKRQEGDSQVPEGFYRIVWFKAKSDYHMAMQVSYPNTSDRVLGHPQHPGGEIMIHGDCVSIGCLAMSDERIEELWVIARSAPRPIDVHIFPTRDMEGLLAQSPGSPHRAFWLNLKEGFDRFDAGHERFGVRVKRDGRYTFFDR
jgi:hypothetical protein